MPASLTNENPDSTLTGSPAAGDGTARATMWPTRALAARERLFDELYVWSEGCQTGTMQRARLQIGSLRKAFSLLEAERVDRVAVTLSFSTIERALDLVTAVFETHCLLVHRLSVMLRGQGELPSSPYRVRSFADWLRSQNVPVGYWIGTARIGMEMKAIDLLQPVFAKLSAPASARLESWQDSLLEARAAGFDTRWVIVSDINTEVQRRLAQEAGFPFGQGRAVRPAYRPPATQPVQP